MDNSPINAALRALEAARGRPILSYVTSTRHGVNAMIADDTSRAFFDKLLLLRAGNGEKLEGVDIFLVSNGGDGTMAWKFVSQLRDIARHIAVLVPARAYSAATLFALGADEIVMGPFGQLGPIDPKVANDFNPSNANGQQIQISVEDVSSYVSFVKHTVGIKKDDQLESALKALTDKVHPLALGNVERFYSQSRMIATKLLKTHVNAPAADAIKDVVETLSSKLYFHGHPIGRAEALQDLHLNVVQPPREIENLMWQLFLEYEKSAEMDTPWVVSSELSKLRVASLANKAAEYARLFGQLKQAQSNLNDFALHQAVENLLARTHPISFEKELPYIYLDTRTTSSTYVGNFRYELLPEQTLGQQLIRSEIIGQRWLSQQFPDAA